jgi:ribosomal protein S12 methylthiotransferase accessory factor
VQGHWLDTEEPVFLPALAVYYDYHAPPAETFCQATSNGLAAGPTLADASFAASLELLERDAFMLSWLTRRPATRVLLDESISPGVREVARRFHVEGAQLELYLLNVGVDVPTILCVAFGDGEAWPGATVALGCHLSPRVAIEKAILEQGQGGPYIRRLMEERERPIPKTPWEVKSLEDHALFYVPRARNAAFEFLSKGDVRLAGSLPEPDSISLSALSARVTTAGLRIAIADVTSRDLRKTPFRVARALGRGFQQIHFGHHLGRLGNPRLVALTNQGSNPDPHPMA